jgi:hypothetical protein
LVKLTYGDAGNIGLAISAFALAYGAATADVKISAILTPLGLGLKAFGSYMAEREAAKEKAEADAAAKPLTLA